MKHLDLYESRKEKNEIKDIIKIFKDFGYDVYFIKNDGDRYNFEMIEGGMRNRFYVMKRWINSTEPIEQIKRIINKYVQISVRYYKIVKALYDYCETIAEGELWTMSSGGMQLQQFYGDDKGYIVILYLSMENDDENTWTHSSSRIGSITPQGDRNEKKFKDFNWENMKNENAVTKLSDLPKSLQKKVDDYLMRKNVKKYNL